MPRLDAQADVRRYLEEKLFGYAEVRVRVPDPRPKRLVVVTRAGGSRLNHWQDRPGIHISVWAPTEAEASALAHRVADCMEDLGRSDAGYLRGYESVAEETMRSDPDPDTDIPRWFISYTLTTHKL